MKDEFRHKDSNIKTGVKMLGAWNFSKIVIIIALLGVFICFWHFAFAAGDKKIAVLELHNYAGLSDAEAMMVSDWIRSVAPEMLPEDKYIVITRESIREMLPPGKQLKDCVGKCEVETGRLIGADYIVAGEILRTENFLRIQFKLFNTATSRLIGTKQPKAKSLDAIESTLKSDAASLLAKLPGAKSQAGGGAVFVTSGVAAPQGEAEVREIAPTEAPPVTASGPAGLYITSKPVGADVYLGDIKAGTTSPAFQKVNLQAGSRLRITLKMNMYHDVAFDVDLKPGVMKFEGVELKPAYGKLVIESEPSGAKVLIGGEKVGVTPFSKSRYPSGDYLVSVEKHWYLPQSDQMIFVRDGQATTKMYTLSQDFGTLDVASNPSGATVALNGKKLGTTPGSWRVLPVENGKVEGSLAKHRGKSFSITIDHDQAVKITTEQATLTGKAESLQVYVNPPVENAQVFVDGKAVGVAPVIVNDLLMGEHRIEVETDDQAGSKTISISEGQTAVAEVGLLTRNVKYGMSTVKDVGSQYRDFVFRIPCYGGRKFCDDSGSRCVLMGRTVRIEKPGLFNSWGDLASSCSGIPKF